MGQAARVKVRRTAFPTIILHISLLSVVSASLLIYECRVPQTAYSSILYQTCKQKSPSDDNLCCYVYNSHQLTCDLRDCAHGNGFKVPGRVTTTTSTTTTESYLYREYDDWYNSEDDSRSTAKFDVLGIVGVVGAVVGVLLMVFCIFAVLLTARNRGIARQLQEDRERAGQIRCETAVANEVPAYETVGLNNENTQTEPAQPAVPETEIMDIPPSYSEVMANHSKFGVENV